MKKTIEFGRYFTKKDELREIEWILLDETPDGKKLLLSKYCLAAMQYEYEENHNKDPKWENCVVRLWLNSYFLNTFFTVREKEKMEHIPVETPEGTILNDKIILLNAEEVMRYIPDENDRRAKPTSWAKMPKHGERIYTNKGYCVWLLRDPSTRFEGNWTGVGSDGKLDLYGGDFYLSGPHGIRPVILVDMK